MKEDMIKKELEAFTAHLESEKKSKATIEKYVTDTNTFLQFAKDQKITKELVEAYKQSLEDKKYAIRSINGRMASVNSYLQWRGLKDCTAKMLSIPWEQHCNEERDLTKTEYALLLKAAQDKPWLSMIMQVIVMTGSNISELQYFTIDAVKKGYICIKSSKSLRILWIQAELQDALLDYAEENDIHEGPIFFTQDAYSLNRSIVWKQMKHLGEKVGVDPAKVYPRNLKKLFVRYFMEYKMFMDYKYRMYFDDGTLE